MATTSRSSVPPSPKALIQLKGVSVAQSEHVVVSDVHLEVMRGEFVYLIGKTGSGKSSLLRALYGDLPLNAGTGRVCDVDLASVNRRNVHALRRLIGIVFQDFALLPDRTVHANLEFVLRATGWNEKAAIEERISECLKAVGLGAKGYKMPHQLSGGEQQRVAIARALLNSPALILADEPTGNLDPETTEEILSLLHGLVRENRTVLMATHDHDALRRHPGRLIRCEQGRIEEDAPVRSATTTAPPAAEGTGSKAGKFVTHAAPVSAAPVTHAAPASTVSASTPVPPLTPEAPLNPEAPVPPAPPMSELKEARETPVAAESDDDDSRFEWDDQDDAWWDNLPGAESEGEDASDLDFSPSLSKDSTAPVGGLVETAELQGDEAEERPIDPEETGNAGYEDKSENGLANSPEPGPEKPGGLPPGIQFKLNR
jgi:cell division transport system ATP-binding protein